MYYFFVHGIPLPITPGALEISTPSMNKTVVLINDGEINIPKEQGLREITFDFLLPQQQKYPFTAYGILDSLGSLGSLVGNLAGNYSASAIIPILNELKKSKKPGQFIVTRMTPNGKPLFFTNIKCLIESFTYKEDAEEYGMDVNCSITLREYKDYGTSVTFLSKLIDVAVGVGATAATMVVAKVTKERSSASKTTPKTVTVKKGDTLWNLCKKHLGDGQKYKEVAKLNNISNPDLIYPGQVLRLS